MKKIQLLILMLCVASVAMAQVFYKKSVEESNYQKKVIYYEKKHGKPVMEERQIWEKPKKEARQTETICRTYNDAGKVLTENLKVKQKQGDKKNILVLNADKEITHNGENYTEIETHQDFILNKTIRSKGELTVTPNQFITKVSHFDFEKNTYLLDYQRISTSSPKKCRESYEYSSFDKKGQPDYQDLALYDNDKDCRILNIYKIRKSFALNKIDTPEIVRCRYDDSLRIMEERHFYKYPTSKWYVRLDSSFTKSDNIGRTILEEEWRSDKSYSKKEIMYHKYFLTKQENVKFIDTLGTHQYTIFNDYNKKDEPLFSILIRYKNGVLDSTAMSILELYTYSYNQKDLLTKKETLAPEYFKGVDLYEYNCQNQLTKLFCIKPNNDTTTYKTEYFDDSCAENAITESNFLLYPNPVTGDELNLQLSENQKLTKYEIVNAAGQFIFYQAQSTEKQVFDIKLNINDLEKGYYFLRAFFDNGESKTKPFIKL